MDAADASAPEIAASHDVPDPDVWSARWARALAVVGLVAWVMPFPELSEDLEHLGLAFPWAVHPRSLMDYGALFLPPLAAVGALLAVQLLRGVGRGSALTAVALVALLVGRWTAGWALAGPGGSGWVRQLRLLGGLFGGLTAAVGNHLRKRAPTLGLARLLCVVGGALLVIAFLIPVDGKPFVAMYFDAEMHRQLWPVLLVSVLVLAYGLLGMRHAGSGPGAQWLCPWMSRLGRILLVAPPLGMIGLNALLFARAPFLAEARFLSLSLRTVKSWGGILGFAGGLAVGVAALLERRVSAEGPTPLEPEAAADAFS